MNERQLQIDDIINQSGSARNKQPKRPITKRRRTMRTIKFKGIDTNGIWHFGDLLHHDNNILIIADDHAHQNKVLCACQFTGFTDHDGNDIYEDDIVEDAVADDIINLDDRIVGWHDGQWAFLNKDAPTDFLVLRKRYSISWRVIGNINDKDAN